MPVKREYRWFRLGDEQQAKPAEDELPHEDDPSNLHNNFTMDSSVAVRHSSKHGQGSSNETEVEVKERKKAGGADDTDEDSGNEDGRESGDQQEQQGVLLQQAMDSISSSTNSLLYGRNVQDIDRISSIRRAAREPLRQLDQHLRLLASAHGPLNPSAGIGVRQLYLPRPPAALRCINKKVENIPPLEYSRDRRMESNRLRHKTSVLTEKAAFMTRR
ncbi:hypothetical protein BGX28_001910 [Mortierella sp. GBA30]|nr:hypothetical protein BGX28_001910 [Mortierella sp. GBA30]